MILFFMYLKPFPHTPYRLPQHIYRRQTHNESTRRETRVGTLTFGEEIFIKTFAGTTETLSFNPAETVGETMAKLASAECVTAIDAELSDLRIRFAGVVLEDEDRLLAEYGVQRDSTLFLDRIVRVSVKDPYFDDSGVEGPGESLSSTGDEVVAVSAWSSSTVGDLLDAIASDKTRNVKRDRMKLHDDKPTPARGFLRILDERKTLTDYGIDEKSTHLVLERLVDIRVIKLRRVVQMWTHEDMEVMYRKLWEKCPEKLIEYPTAAEFLYGCQQTKEEVLRSGCFYN